MRKQRRFVGVRHTLLIAAVGILSLAASAAAASNQQADLSADALKALVPEGYKVEKTMACGADNAAQREHLVALSDVDDLQIKAKPVMLLLVAVGKKIVVEDSVTLHNDARTSEFWSGPPNYFSGMTREKVGGGDLILVASTLSGGGSGFLTYFDFYRPEKKKLRLVKSFSHGRMEVPYFAVYKDAIYDADCVCTRGEKRGKAFVYTCYLQVTKYTFDGVAIRPVGSERMREQHGNRYLQDKYRNMSVLKALQKGEIFTQAP
jgi:hypothetical protein